MAVNVQFLLVTKADRRLSWHVAKSHTRIRQSRIWNLVESDFNRGDMHVRVTPVHSANQ